MTARRWDRADSPLEGAGRRTSMMVAGQSAVNYTWDSANRLTGITQGTSSVGLAYDNANRRTTLTLPNGVKVSYTYDLASHITGLTYAMGSTQLGNLTYTYDADGRATAKGGSLAAVNLPTAVSGNAFNAANEMTQFGARTMSYDANGNLASDGTNTYTWDARNHLSAMSGPVNASFVYDAFGRRTSKALNGVTTEFFYDGLNPVQELNGNNPPSPTANLLTGLNIDEYFTRTDTTGTRNFLTDALGSAIALTDPSGTIQSQYTYEPFGNVTASGQANANPYQFTGRENDGTGLYLYRARYYSPTFQRFIAQDPVPTAGNRLISFLLTPRVSASQRLNAYLYALDDPVLFADPLGLDPLCVGIWIAVAQNEIAVPFGDPRTGGGTGFCSCFWGCRACNGSLDLYNSDNDRPSTSGVETGGGECTAPPPGPQTGCPDTSSN